jgi:hypothetical protein
MDAAARFFSALDSVGRHMPVGRREVATAFDADWVSEDERQDPHFTILRGRVIGPLAAVVEGLEFREPKNASRGGFLHLTLAGPVALTAGEIVARFADTHPEPASPTAPVTVPDGLVAPRPWGTLRFGVARDGSSRVVSASLDPPAAPGLTGSPRS